MALKRKRDPPCIAPYMTKNIMVNHMKMVFVVAKESLLKLIDYTLEKGGDDSDLALIEELENLCSRLKKVIAQHKQEIKD